MAGLVVPYCNLGPSLRVHLGLRMSIILARYCSLQPSIARLQLVRMQMMFVVLIVNSINHPGRELEVSMTRPSIHSFSWSFRSQFSTSVPQASTSPSLHPSIGSNLRAYWRRRFLAS